MIVPLPILLAHGLAEPCERLADVFGLQLSQGFVARGDLLQIVPHHRRQRRVALQGDAANPLHRGIVKTQSDVSHSTGQP